MLLPNNQGFITPRSATSFNAYGEPIYDSSKRVLVRCSVVKLDSTIKKTPIRTDTSASRGNSDEKVSVATILFLPSSGIGVGDRFEIANLDLRVNGAQPRFDVLGNFDHIECTFEAWVDEG